MKMQAVTIKLGAVVLISLGLNACSMLPSADGVFIDEKENYKKAHQLPELEIPPELLKGQQLNEYDGGVKGAVTTVNNDSPLKTTPLSDLQTTVELIDQGLNSRLLMRDSLRNVWRKTLSALEALDYDIEDKNRETAQIYLNLAKDTGSDSMLSGLSFWKTVETSVYVIALEQQDDGVEISVLDEAQQQISDVLSDEVLSRLLAELAL
ncbi:MAG: outer membrane protein assembly factor BamC [Cycloclasticus sp.]